MPTSVQMQRAIPKAYRDTVKDRNEADVRLWARFSGGKNTELRNVNFRFEILDKRRDGREN